MFCHDAFAVGQDRVLVLHHAVRRQPAVALRPVHRAAGQQNADPEPPCDGDFDIDGVLEPGGKDIMMIGCRGAARQQQFRHRHGDAEVEGFGRKPRPHRVERLQPGKQFAVERRRQRARQRLVEMVMGVDQPGQHDMIARLKERRRIRRLPAPRHQLHDLAVLDDYATLGAIGEDGQGILDPNRPLWVRHPWPSPSDTNR